MKAVMSEIDKRNKLAKELEPHIGTFSCDGMTTEEVAKYACKKLGIHADKGEHRAILKGYLLGKKKSSTTVYGIDEAIKEVFSPEVDKASEAYLKDE